MPIHAHPAGATDTGDRECLATQIFGPLDARSYYQIVGVAAVKCGDDFKIMPRGDGSQNCAAAGTPDMNAAGGHAGDQSRCAADKNRIDVDAIFGEKALLWGEPKRHDPCVVCGLTDNVLAGTPAPKA